MNRSCDLCGNLYPDTNEYFHALTIRRSEQKFDNMSVCSICRNKIIKFIGTLTKESK